MAVAGVLSSRRVVLVPSAAPSHGPRTRTPLAKCWPSRVTQANGGAAAAASACGAKSLEDIQCHTIIEVQGPEDLQYILQGNDLVAETFYNASDNMLVDAVNFNSYRVRAAAQTIGLHMSPSQTHATILALANTQGQQRGSNQQAVGVVNVTLMQASDSISAAASCKPGTPFAMITNMAVVPAMRRRGIANQLLEVAVRTAILKLDYTPVFALLLAYKYHEPAVRLYEAWGFESTNWQDPLWRLDAEKGKFPGRQRRIMMVKPLSGPSMAVNPMKRNFS